MKNENRRYVAWLVGRRERHTVWLPKVLAFSLGIHFSREKHISDKLNFEKKLEDLHKILHSRKRRKLTLLVYDSAWKGKPHKIKKTTLIGDRDKGGLIMIQFESMNKTLKASWVKRFNYDTNSPWKIIPNYITYHLGGFKFLLACNYKTKELALVLSRS